jgi:hypothetical protein
MIDELSQAIGTIRVRGIPISTVAQLCGISQGELSALVNYQKPCTSERAARIWKSVQALDSLVREVEPLPIDLRRAIVLRELLMRRENGTFKVAVTLETR